MKSRATLALATIAVALTAIPTTALAGHRSRCRTPPPRVCADACPRPARVVYVDAYANTAPCAIQSCGPRVVAPPCNDGYAYATAAYAGSISVRFGSACQPRRSACFSYDDRRACDRGRYAGRHDRFERRYNRSRRCR